MPAVVFLSQNSARYTLSTVNPACVIQPRARRGRWKAKVPALTSIHSKMHFDYNCQWEKKLALGTGCRHFARNHLQPLFTPASYFAELTEDFLTEHADPPSAPRCAFSIPSFWDLFWPAIVGNQCFQHRFLNALRNNEKFNNFPKICKSFSLITPPLVCKWMRSACFTSFSRELALYWEFHH